MTMDTALSISPGAPAADVQTERFRPGPVVAFFVLAYGLSWGWEIPWAVTGHTVTQGNGWPTHLPALVGPMAAAFIVTWFTQGRLGIRDLVTRMGQWRIGWRWWGAVFAPLAFFLILLATMASASVQIPARKEFVQFSGVSSTLGIAGLVLVLIVIDGLGEETGWRGFALPQLQLRFGPITASVIIGLLWAGWHVPLFFLIKSYRDFTIAMLPIFVIGLVCAAIVWAWIYNRTGSILAVAVWHGLYNITGATAAANDHGGLIGAAMWTFVVVNAIAVLVIDRRARKSGRASILLPISVGR